MILVFLVDFWISSESLQDVSGQTTIPDRPRAAEVFKRKIKFQIVALTNW
jgi:hypothetical protein